MRRPHRALPPHRPSPPPRTRVLAFPSVTVGGTGAALAGVWLVLTLSLVLATLAV